MTKNLKIEQEISGNIYVVTAEDAQILKASEREFGKWHVLGETDDAAPRTAKVILSVAPSIEDLDG